MGKNINEHLDELECAADQAVENIKDWIVETRRKVHMHPELAFEEKATSELVVAGLKEAGWEVRPNVAGYGVIGIMNSRSKYGQNIAKDYCLAFRADMDALPIQEDTGASYASRNPGKMHACGHDNHIAIGLGMARVLAKLRGQWDGTVKLIFEPAEETGGGAELMIKAGALQNPNVDAIINLAVGTSIFEGQFRFIEGPALPRIDNFEIKVGGESSHGGEPHRGIDAIVLASEIVIALQRVVSRQVSVADPVILNVYNISGGHPDGVIPDEVMLYCTLRSYTDSVRLHTFDLIRKAANGIAESYGGKATVTVTKEAACIVGYHDPAITRLVADVATDVVGKDNIIYETKPDWGGDSFASYAENIPGTFVWLGVRNEKEGRIYPVHHPKFDVNDKILPLAVKVGCRAAFRLLQKELLNPDGQKA
jgi:amidohydrolase